jgi:uncharacterized membrane protein YoaT (DUF817 family)
VELSGARPAAAGVPMFSGFMYASVGSHIARIWRIQHLRFEDYPPA